MSSFLSSLQSAATGLAGTRTTVVLGDLKTGMQLDDEQFVIPGVGVEKRDR